MSAATEAYERLLADQRRNALLPPKDKIEAAKAAQVRDQTIQIRRATKGKAPA